MKIEIRNRTDHFTSIRAARVAAMFNCDTGANFDLDVDLPIDDGDWKIGVVVGPSGSGKTSIGRAVFGESAMWSPEWPFDKPIIDAVLPDVDEGGFDQVHDAFRAVGLGSVPTWLRPYHALSNGEQFRADLGRLVCERPAHVVVDEFTSVVDRQVAKFGALAFSKAWKRGEGQAVLLTPHYDVIEWIEPEWVYDTGAGRFARGRLRRPYFDLEIRKVDSSFWRLFEPHHYLKLPLPVASFYYVGTVDGELVCHAAITSSLRSSMKREVEARVCRLVVMPEWQGAGVGLRFLNELCEMQERGDPGARHQFPTTTIFQTAHPTLCKALRADRRWRQIQSALHGVNKVASKKHFLEHKSTGGLSGPRTGYGGHFRAIQSFRFYGQKGIAARDTYRLPKRARIRDR